MEIQMGRGNPKISPLCKELGLGFNVQLCPQQPPTARPETWSSQHRRRFPPREYGIHGLTVAEMVI